MASAPGLATILSPASPGRLSARFPAMGDKSPKNTQKTTKQKVQAKTAKPAAAAAVPKK